MFKFNKKILYWSPRILATLFVAFLCLISFDSFSEYDGWRSVVAIMMHFAIPAIVLLGTIIAWKKDLYGTAIFLFFAVYYVYMVGLNRHWSWYLSIAGPALLIAGLFLFNWLCNKNK